jgi:hypothetical protein
MIPGRIIMKMQRVGGIAMALALLAGCQKDGVGGPVKSAASTVASVPSLVNVDLRNVLNDLALDLKLDKANVPINAQIPVTLAVNVCGVSVNVLAVSTGGQANCTAKTASPELAQVVQQQIAAGGSVGGGAQGGSTATNFGPSSPGASNNNTENTTTGQAPTVTSPVSSGSTLPSETTTASTTAH